jgi:uncharacterized protein (DUF433 family)
VTDQSWADRVVADLGEGYPVEQIAARYGLTVDQVHAVGRQAPGSDPGPS